MSCAAKVLAETLDAATGKFLDEDRSPGRKLGTIDNRGSHFYLALYWAEALAAQSEDAKLKAQFTPIAADLKASEEKLSPNFLPSKAGRLKSADITNPTRPEQLPPSDRA